MEASTVAEVLLKEIVCRYGVPRELHSDQGHSFESRIVHDLCAKLGINKTCTSPYRPQSDGLAKRFMRTLKSQLCKLTEGTQVQWERSIPWLLLYYRATE